MRKWIYDRPWIWIVVFLSALIAASIATVIIAEVNKPEIVKPKTPRKARGGAPSSQVMASQATALRWLDGCDRVATCAGASITDA